MYSYAIPFLRAASRVSASNPSLTITTCSESNNAQIHLMPPLLDILIISSAVRYNNVYPIITTN